jgi:hypothetical protein
MTGNLHSCRNSQLNGVVLSETGKICSSPFHVLTDHVLTPHCRCLNIGFGGTLLQTLLSRAQTHTLVLLLKPYPPTAHLIKILTTLNGIQ